MSNEVVSANARALLDNPLLNESFGKLERDALEECVNAKPEDDTARLIATHKVRAIRDLREQLTFLIGDKTKQPTKTVV